MDEGQHRHDRRTFLGAAAMSLGAFGAAGSALPAGAAGAGGPSPAAETPEAALALLKEGNARFVSGQSKCGPLTARVIELEAGQAPFAIVLGCSDSRVPIETIFDQIPGNVFVVRVAGNFLTTDGLGSIEYGVAALKASLLVVLGHSACGAVKATVDFLKDGNPQPGHIQSLVTAIEPAAKAARSAPGDWLSNAIAENVRQNVHASTARSTIVSDAVNSGKLEVVGAVYELGTGKVAFL
ncbi:MAG TPA: carbonic anhydrase [Candidatus Acidoferrales bacterium]|nr:carbonic anhydrase [Candidatus Acidoferrales bacterium]